MVSFVGIWKPMMISLLSFYMSVFESSVNLFVLSASTRFASPLAWSPMTWLLLLGGASVVVPVAMASRLPVF